MIENVTSTDQFLYHYTKPSTALETILKHRSLKFDRYCNTNDPKESKNWQFDIGTNEERDLGQHKMDELSVWLSSELKKKAFLACFSMDTAPLTGDHVTDIFNRGFCKPRMWAQYAEKHKGVCLVFDRKKLTKMISTQLSDSCLITSGPVEYINRRVIRNFEDQPYLINIDFLESVGGEVYANSHLRTHFKRLFFEKMTDWRDETEWRWVMFSESGDELYVNYKDSLVGIMFGENTEELIVQETMDLTDSWDLKYMGLKWKNCSPWYDYDNLRYVHGIKDSPWGSHIQRV